MKKLSPESKQVLYETYVEMAKPKPDFRLPDYKSYLKNRKLLNHYSFCPLVLEDLLDLCLKYLNNDEKANRTLLVEQTVRHLFELIRDRGAGTKWEYALRGQPNASSIEKLFKLGDEVIRGKNSHIKPELKKAVSWKILKALSLLSWDIKGLKWLDSWKVYDEEVVKTILEASQNLETTRDWILHHEKHPCVVPFRIHHVARMLDIDPDYVVLPAFLVNDCKILNKMDEDYIRSIMDSEKEFERLDNEPKQEGEYLFVSGKELDAFDDVFYNEFDSFVDNPSPRKSHASKLVPMKTIPELEQERKRDYEYRYYKEDYMFRTRYRRGYSMPLKYYEEEKVFKPDFDAALKEVSERVDYYQAKTMMWGIALSNMPDKKKMTLLRKWTTDETLRSLIRIAKTLNKPEWIRG
jgi:hypothetical protein